MDHGLGAGSDLRHHLQHQDLTLDTLKTLLHLAPDGAQLWQKAKGQWLPVDRAQSGSVWVVTDMAEETISEIQVPRLYGQDRSGFINRQLTSRFPETPYKIALPASSQTSLLNRLAPLRQTLLALDAKERIDQVLDELDAKVAGLWSTSGLLARLGASKTLPGNLFVVVPGLQSMRILFLKERVPIISRLISEPSTSQLVNAEIIRTLRHLENTKVIERNSEKPPVLVLGNREGIAQGLLDEQLLLIEVPAALRKVASSDFKFALFDLAIQSPPGQLAPLSRRTAHIAAAVGRWAYTIAAAIICFAVWNLLASFQQIQDVRASIARSQGTLTELGRKLTMVDKSIAAYPVTSELVKNTIRLERDELLSAPSLPRQLTSITEALAADPALRLGRLDWSIQSPTGPFCPKDTAIVPATAVAPSAPASDAAARTSRSRISFDLVLPPTLTGKARTSVIAAVSERLASVPGVTLQLDPAKLQIASSLAGGSRPADTAPVALAWCLDVSNASPSLAPSERTKP